MACAANPAVVEWNQYRACGRGKRWQCFPVLLQSTILVCSVPRGAQTPAAFLGTPGLKSVAPSVQTAHEGSRRVKSAHCDQGIFPLSMKPEKHQQNLNRSSSLMSLLMPLASSPRWSTFWQTRSALVTDNETEDTSRDTLVIPDFVAEPERQLLRLTHATASLRARAIAYFPRPNPLPIGLSSDYNAVCASRVRFLGLGRNTLQLCAVSRVVAGRGT